MRMRLTRRMCSSRAPLPRPTTSRCCRTPLASARMSRSSCSCLAASCRGEEYFARVDAVTTDVVRDCASRRIQDQDMAISAVGELSFLPHYNWFRRRSYWNRY